MKSFGRSALNNYFLKTKTELSLLLSSFYWDNDKQDWKKTGQWQTGIKKRIFGICNKQALFSKPAPTPQKMWALKAGDTDRQGCKNLQHRTHIQRTEGLTADIQYSMVTMINTLREQQSARCYNTGHTEHKYLGLTVRLNTTALPKHKTSIAQPQYIIIISMNWSPTCTCCCTPIHSFFCCFFFF